MTLLDEAVARYHKLLESKAFKDGAWAKDLDDKMAARKLILNARPACPVLRPLLIPRRQFDTVQKNCELLYSASVRVCELALANPAVMARMGMLPAEKMLAASEPGYSPLAVLLAARTRPTASGFQFQQFLSEEPGSVAMADALSEIFYTHPSTKEFRKKHKLTRTPAIRRLLRSILAVYKNGGKKKFPRIAVVEFRPPFKNTPGAENELLAEHFRSEGYPTEVVTPEQLEYRNGVLCRGDFGIEIVYRRVPAQELLVRLELAHPLFRSYRDGAVCMVNSFRAEILQKRAILGLLTDEEITAKFPAAERKAIRDHVPWTRLVGPVKTMHGSEAVDLPEFVQANRESLVLLPNDSSGELPVYVGAESDQAAWERALRLALRSPYVVQQTAAPAWRRSFPVRPSGAVEFKEMDVELLPYLFLGKPEGCTATVRDVTSNFSTLNGLAPAFVMQSGG